MCCSSCGSQVSLRAWEGNTVNTDRWAVYYDYKLPASNFQRYDLVVFDRIYYPDFSAIQRKTIILAYISAGEIGTNTPEKAILEQEHAILSERSKWDTHTVDLSSARWHDLVMEAVDDALKKGFDGIMLDTIDSPLHAAATQSHESSEQSKRAAIALIKDIRDKHPRIKIMLNRAFDILPQVANQIDYVLAESILTENNDSTGQSRLVAPNTYQEMAASLRWAHDLSPDIKIYTLDYWNLNDVDGIKRIYRMQREQGFSPYVTAPDLRHFTPEPE